MKNLKNFPEYFIALIFLALPLIIQPSGGWNAAARLAPMAAFVESGSVEITAYTQGEHPWTEDWASKDGVHRYANKSPGGIYLGLPFFWLYDFVATRHLADRAERDAFRQAHEQHYGVFLALFTQILPLIFLFLLSLRIFFPGATPPEKLVVAIAYFLANTTALVAGLYWGHALVSALLLGAWLSWTRGRWALWAWLLSAAVTVEASAVLAVVGFLFLLPDQWPALRKLRRQQVLGLCVTGLLPLLLMGLYHQIIFQDFFALAQKYQNPIFKNPDHPTGSGLGQFFSFLPSTHALKELLFGNSRGILWTQPWIFLLLWPTSRGRKFIFPIFGFYLWMNASFNGWHGGHSPGPRYLAPVLAFFAFLIVDAWRGQKIWWRVLLVTGLLYSSALYFHLYTSKLLSPEHIAIWGKLAS